MADSFIGERLVQVPVEGADLDGNLVVPEKAVGVVLFAHGSGSSRHSPRNRYVAGVLQRAGLATLTSLQFWRTCEATKNLKNYERAREVVFTPKKVIHHEKIASICTGAA